MALIRRADLLGAAMRQATPSISTLRRASALGFRDMPMELSAETPGQEGAAVADAAPVPADAVPELPFPEPAEGETVRLPDIVPDDPAPVSFVQADPVMPTFSYNTGMIQLSGPLSTFGTTKVLPPSVRAITVTPVLGWYVLSALLDQQITYQV